MKKCIFKGLLPLITVVSLLGLTACSLGPVKQPVIHSYTLNGVSHQSLSKYPSVQSLQVLDVTAAEGYSTQAMLYRDAPYALKSFSRNRWFSPPAKMLYPVLVQSLQNTGYFHAVVPSMFSSSTHLRLNVMLVKLYQDVSVTPNQVEMALQVSLMDSKTSRIIATQTFDAKGAVEINTPYGGVLAANHTTVILMQRISTFVVNESR